MASISHQHAEQTAEASSHSAEEIEQTRKALYDVPIQNRYAVAGKAFVDRSLEAGSSDFVRPMQVCTLQLTKILSYVWQEYVTQACWGSIWSRPGLERKQRSLLNIAMLCALNRSTELGVHVRGAINNGASQMEIRETLLQAACYCGIEGFKVAESVIKVEVNDRISHPNCLKIGQIEMATTSCNYGTYGNFMSR